MIEDGEAVPVYGRVDGVREVVAIQRTLGKRADASNSGISAPEMRELAAGSRVARQKVREWGELQRANFARLIAA